jgi:hypothetical protein
VDIAANALAGHSRSQSRQSSPVCSLMNIMWVDGVEEEHLSVKKKYDQRSTSWARSRSGETLFRTGSESIVLNMIRTSFEAPCFASFFSNGSCHDVLVYRVMDINFDKLNLQRFSV